MKARTDRWARRWPWVLALVAAGAWVLRALPFFHRHGTLGAIVHYDESVYFTASSLLWRGLLPYRDYLFVHPPGAPLLLAPVSAMSVLADPAVGFAAARWLATAAGAASTFLAGRLALKLWGPAAGVVAALAYAMNPDIVGRERGPFLDPLLNLGGLSLATVWLLPAAPGREARRALGAGVLAGLSVTVKVLGGIWAAAALLSRAPGPGWRWHTRFTLAAGLTVLAVVGPLAAVAPGALVRDVVAFQAERPADGVTDRWARLADMLPERRRAAVVLMLAGLVVALARTVRPGARERTAERFVAVVYLLSVTANLLARSYWHTYNALLAPAEALLAGLGAAALVDLAAARGRAWAGVAFGLVGLAPFHSLRETLRGAHDLIPEQALLARYVREHVPADAVLCSFDPGWLLLGGRLPPVVHGAPVVVDSYALMLQGAMQSGARPADVVSAFKVPASQDAMVRLLERCDFTLLGWRGRWQLSPENLQGFEASHTRRLSTETWLHIDAWERTVRPAAP